MTSDGPPALRSMQHVLDALEQCDELGWAHDLHLELTITDPEMRAATVDDVVGDLCAHTTSRSRALLILIDVCMFTPAGVRWDARRRRSALEDLTSALPGLTTADLERITRETSAIRRSLGRRQLRWGRVAIASAARIGVGIATMGAATPAIAAAVAGAGLSGAAATSAGLAALGGGSLAAGGFGMAGGSMLLNGIGVVSGLGVGAAGSWLSGWSATEIAEEALRLAVATRLVVIDEQSDEELARRVVLAMQERLDDVAITLETLTRRLRELSDTNDHLTAENRRLRAEFRTRCADTRQIEAALETALERIHDATPGGPLPGEDESGEELSGHARNGEAGTAA